MSYGFFLSPVENHMAPHSQECHCDCLLPLLAQLEGVRSCGKEMSKDGACVICVLQIEEVRPGEEVHSHFPKTDKAVRSQKSEGENTQSTNS